MSKNANGTSFEVVRIYTDGACKGNPGPGGWGAVLQMDGGEKELFGGERQLHRLGAQAAARLETGADFQRDARLAQEVQARKAELHRVVAEHVLDRGVELLSLPPQHVRALGSFEPIG